MCYWIGLYLEGSQQAISEGIDLMLRTALKLLGKQGKRQKLMLMNGQGVDGQPDPDDHGDEAKES
jgi:hypothetical protein